jgi:thiosulfate/3-mercaptopyruvate sulfurtransferase
MPGLSKLAQDDTSQILVDPSWLAERIGTPNLVIFDATVKLAAPRFDGDYQVSSGHASWLHAHIPQARHADILNTLSDTQSGFGFTRPAPDRLLRELSRLGMGSDRTIVIYDAENGFWSARLWYLLRSIGMPAKVLNGGLKAWQAHGLPVVQGEEPALPPGHIVSQPQHARWANQADVSQILAGARAGILVCALSPPVFSGGAHTRYARRGHIPGSINLPARDLLDKNGLFLPREQLIDKTSVLWRNPLRPVLLYCGGGISACVVALALALLGRKHVSIYDGSLEEWAANPDLALQTRSK